jgi:hypothetical protein
MDTLCPICFENFEEDEAHIPELECGCAIIVHSHCWEPWSGECLYCRNTREEPIYHIQAEAMQAIQVRYVVIHNDNSMCFYIFISIVLSIFISSILNRLHGTNT